MKLLRPRSVRLRLALWFTTALCVGLLFYAAAIYGLVRRSFLEELDQGLHEDFEYAGAMLVSSGDGGVRWRGSGEAEEERGYALLEVRDAEGRLLFRDPPARGEAWTAGGPARRGPESIRLSGDTEGRPVRWMSRPYRIGGCELVIGAARSEEAMRAELARLALVLALGIPLAALIAGGGGYWLARRALAPVDRIAERARAITAERLSERLSVDNPRDELGRLAAAFNDAFERLERSFASLKRFTADASHELRTPLTALRSVGEVALRGKHDEAAYREVIGSMLEEVDRLGRLVDDLLLLSRADADKMALARERIDLSQLAREAAARMEVLAEEKRQDLRLETDGALLFEGDATVLREALLNLLDNAIQYSPPGACIRLSAARRGDALALEVSDTGPGIAPEHRERVFERFYRIDPARSRELRSAGLGLSIARWAVEAHGGRIELESELGRGSTFRIVLPEREERAT